MQGHGVPGVDSSSCVFKQACTDPCDDFFCSSPLRAASCLPSIEEDQNIISRREERPPHPSHQHWDGDDAWDSVQQDPFHIAICVTFLRVNKHRRFAIQSSALPPKRAHVMYLLFLGFTLDFIESYQVKTRCSSLTLELRMQASIRPPLPSRQ